VEDGSGGDPAAAYSLHCTLYTVLTTLYSLYCTHYIQWRMDLEAIQQLHSSGGLQWPFIVQVKDSHYALTVPTMHPLCTHYAVAVYRAGTAHTLYTIHHTPYTVYSHTTYCTLYYAFIVQVPHNSTHLTLLTLPPPTTHSPHTYSNHSHHTPSLMQPDMAWMHEVSGLLIEVVLWIHYRQWLDPVGY
jgi:hypothetical protein